MGLEDYPKGRLQTNIDVLASIKAAEMYSRQDFARFFRFLTSGKLFVCMFTLLCMITYTPRTF